ncbi:MAG: hypothetical protein Q4G19_06920 [Clostridia bacterium]|nr:hypothetical protein [Clostridia bacterium]
MIEFKTMSVDSADARIYTRILLECRDRNTHAVAFYHRTGYTECTKYGPFADEDDAVYMDKYL